MGDKMQEIGYSVLALIISFSISIGFGAFLIPKLRVLKFGQNVREDGPKSHVVKNGIPTMGGIMFIGAVVVTILIFIIFLNYNFTYYIGIFLVVFLGLG